MECPYCKRNYKCNICTYNNHVDKCSKNPKNAKPPKPIRVKRTTTIDPAVAKYKKALIEAAKSIWLEKKRDPFYNSERLTIIFDAINKGDITKIPEYIRSRLILDKGQVSEPKWNNLIYRSKN